MDEGRESILGASRRILSKLQLLATYFGEEIIYNVYLRSTIIHQLFENNAELDINKLDLFHLQFTATLIELLKKIKRSNEKGVSLLLDEIQVNQELVTTLEGARSSEEAFRLEKPRQALKINTSLRRLYEALSADSSEYPFAKNILSFSARYASDFYSTVSSDIWQKLIHFEVQEVYSNAHAIIQRKLMGLLCKHEFRTEFYCGLKSSNQIIEVYKIAEPEIFYIYYPSRNLFLLCDTDEIKEIEASKADHNQKSIIQELCNKIDELKSSVSVAKVYLPVEIKHLLSEHYKKISDINFLQNMSNFDVQANILKSMLNTHIF